TIFTNLVTGISDVTNLFTNMCPKLSSVTRTWRAIDACSNAAFCNQTVTIVDTTPPNLVCAPDRIIECSGSDNFTNTFTTPTAVDVCAGTNVTVVAVGDIVTNVPNPRCPRLFSATRTWRATDPCTNTAHCSQTITYVDTTPPHITCADSLILECGIPF